MRSDNLIRVNTKFFDKRHRAQCGSNIVHEQGHKLGFSHDFRRTKDRPSSICYQLNKAYEAAYSKIYNTYPEIKRVTNRSWKHLWLKKISYEVSVWPEY